MLKQEQKLQQRQTLSPQQIQAIRLLELPEIELEEQIKQELIDNPALDEGDAHASAEEENDITPEEDASGNESAEDLLMGDYNNNDEVPSYIDREIPGENAPREEIPVSGGTTFHDYLLEQLHRGFFQPSFRQGNAQRLHHRSPPFKLISRVSRPTKSTWEIPRLLA